MTQTIQITAIAHVASGRSAAIDDDWGEVHAKIVLTDDFTPDALAGLQDFSHIEVIFHFDKVLPEKIETGARHPRNNKNWPLVGIFAQRGKNRPNRIGSTICRLVSVSGKTIEVSGLDAIDRTPILDIKPVMQEFLPREKTSQPNWATELMKGYWQK
ncbi:MAG: hypothetical protein FD163_1928 [Hyphomonadaceae bacterium]|nr:MAG: hypothetical protein FD163_1928 [Hyphomonadaceae bacterium]